MQKIIEHIMARRFQITFKRAFYKQCILFRTNIDAREFDASYTKTYNEHSYLLSDRQSSVHLMMTSLVLTAYRMLKDAGADSASISKILRRAFLQPQQKSTKLSMKIWLLFARDPFRSITKLSKRKEKDVYGKSFEFQVEHDDAQRYFVNVTKCFYFNFFQKNDVPELTQIFCDFDNVWGDELDSKHSNVKFERPGTLGYGARSCQFHFSKIR